MPPSPTAQADLIVLGAGPAGVGAAYRTARAGHKVVVLERAPGPGGAAASFELDGVRGDHGSHRLQPPPPGDRPPYPRAPARPARRRAPAAAPQRPYLAGGPLDRVPAAPG